MTDADKNTESTGWGTAKVQLSGELDYDADAEWSEGEPPENETDDRSFDLDDDKINEAEKQAEEINELLGF